MRYIILLPLNDFKLSFSVIFRIFPCFVRVTAIGTIVMIFSSVDTEDGFQNVQQDINKLLDWSETWQMKFNINKCKVMHIGRHNSEQKYYMRA